MALQLERAPRWCPASVTFPDSPTRPSGTKDSGQGLELTRSLCEHRGWGGQVCWDLGTVGSCAWYAWYRAPGSGQGPSSEPGVGARQVGRGKE